LIFQGRVDWIFTPAARLPEFKPPFCPNRRCPEHLRDTPGFRYRKKGFFSLKSGRKTQRFICMTCGKKFSTSTFSITYWLKRPELLPGIAAGLQAGSAHRQIARSLDCAASTVTRQGARIGRHCILLHERGLQSLSDALTEPIVFDHFETFEFTQDLPFGVATAVGSASWFVYGIDPAPHRRTGRLSPAQRKRLRKRPRRARHGGYDASSLRSIQRLLSLNEQGEPLRLISDDHPAYRTAVKRLDRPERVHHEIHPNPRRGPKGSARSSAARVRDRALFPVDLLHGLMRHSLAAHKRETIAFGRRLNALMERLFVFLAWRNFIKGRSERKPDRTTPAMRLGLTDRPWSWSTVFARRLFPVREGLRGVNLELYRREWTTPVLPSNRPHDLKLAY
jgi:transposase-like protein